MATDDTIRIAYNSKTMRIGQAFLGIFALACAYFAALCLYTLGQGASGWFLRLTCVVLWVPFFGFGAYTSFLEWRFYHHRERSGQPAFVVTKSGIEEYASRIRVGAIGWEEIEKMYFWDGGMARLFRIPIRKQRFLVIHLKNGDYLGRLNRKARFYATSSYRHSKTHTLLVPEHFLSVPAPEIMHRLNRFYLDMSL